MGNTLAIMLTMTTYGTWLRGDQRGWIDDGELMPPNPILEAGDRKRMKHSVFLFDHDQLVDIGEMIGRALIERLDLQVLALTVQTWHAHIVFAATRHDVAAVGKCAKDAARYGLRPGRPIWTEGYDKRFCFDERTTHNRVTYVERHNTRLGFAARPWDFITPGETYLADFAARRARTPLSPPSLTGAKCRANRIAPSQRAAIIQTTATRPVPATTPAPNAGSAAPGHAASAQPAHLALRQ